MEISKTVYNLKCIQTDFYSIGLQQFSISGGGGGRNVGFV